MTRLPSWIHTFLIISCYGTATTTITTNAYNHDGGYYHQQQQQQQQRSLPWSIESYPHPEKSPDICRTTSMRFCDPDGVLYREVDLQRVEDALVKNVPFLPKPGSACYEILRHSQHPLEYEYPAKLDVQLAVALVKKMDLTQMRGEYESRAKRMSEHFARSLHDIWGVGLRTECGGTGVMLFLSEEDRKVYISRGSALDPILTNRRLDKVMNHMKPLLKQAMYAQAILKALDELESLIQVGEPDYWERLEEKIALYGGLTFVFGFFGIMIWAIKNGQQRTREYARVQSQLNELDRARAEALQGRFQSKSCPICLEDFPLPPPHLPTRTNTTTVDNENKKDKNETDTTQNSDDNNQDDKKDDDDNKNSTDTDNNSNANDYQAPQKGSDGLPLKLLRCGHVFDSTCFQDWINSGQGDVNTCPICKQDVGPTPSVNTRGPTTAGGATSSIPFVGTRQQIYSNRTMESPLLQRRQNYQDDYHEMMLRRYNHERNFRLMRLATQYPRYVQQEHIQRWTQPGYDGTMARDPTFLRNDPRQQVNNNAGGRSGNHSGSFRSRSGGSGFGGGSSSGGRGGSW